MQSMLLPFKENFASRFKMLLVVVNFDPKNTQLDFDGIIIDGHALFARVSIRTAIRLLLYVQPDQKWTN